MTYALLSKKEVDYLIPFESDLSDSELAQYVYSRWYYDVGFFVDYFLEGNSYLLTEDKMPVARHRYAIRSALDNEKKIVLIEPRWHGKTTAILCRILHALLYKRCRSILYVASEDLGKKGIGKIRGELETNELILSIFGETVPANSDDMKDKRLKKWRDTELELLNGTHLQTVSKWGSVRGQRPKKIVIDDPQENKDVENRRVVDKFNRWVFTSLFNTLLPGGSIAVIGTIVWNLCLTKHLRDKKWRHTIEREACDDKFENILWPEFWTKEALIERRQDIGSAEFNQEYRNIPLQTGVALIKEMWLKYWEYKPEKFDRLILSIDLKSSLEEKGDDMGISLVWKIDDRFYSLYSAGVLLTPKKQELFIRELYKKFDPDIILIEQAVERGIIEELKLSGLPVKGIKPDGSKSRRLMSIAGKIEFWKVLLRPWDKDEKLEFQLTHFPDVEHDDIMDAFVYAILYSDVEINTEITAIKR